MPSPIERSICSSISFRDVSCNLGEYSRALSSWQIKHERCCRTVRDIFPALPTQQSKCVFFSHKECFPKSSQGTDDICYS